MNVFANNTEIFKPDSGYAELAGQTIRVPYANQLETSTGLDISGSHSDVIDLTVPLSMTSSHIKNSSFQLNVQEALVERRITDNVKAAVRRLGSLINTSIADKIIDEGALCAGETTALTDFDDFATAGTMLDEVEAYAMDKCLFLPPRISQGLSNQLGMRQTDNNRDHKAYEYGELPSINEFKTYKSNSVKQIAAENVTTVTVNGANQDVDPKAYDSDATLTQPDVDDIRYQTLTVTNTSGSLTNGDIFSIAGVNRVGIDSKTDTGELMTFRVISGGGTTTVTISPAIVASGPYQNVSAIPANGAAITAHNTVAATPAVFMTKDAVSLFCSDLNWGQLENSANVVLDTYTTSSGIQVAFIRQGDAETGLVTYRFTTWTNPNIKDPLKCGVLLPSQSAAF